MQKKNVIKESKYLKNCEVIFIDKTAMVNNCINQIILEINHLKTTIIIECKYKQKINNSWNY